MAARTVIYLGWKLTMRPSPARPVASLLAAILLLSPSSFAFDTPLSDQAVREAYFLGQRRDESLARFLDKSTRVLPPPKTAPPIAAVTPFTHFAPVPKLSPEHTTAYTT